MKKSRLWPSGLTAMSPLNWPPIGRIPYAPFCPMCSAHRMEIKLITALQGNWQAAATGKANFYLFLFFILIEDMRVPLAHLLEPLCSNIDSGSCNQTICEEADGGKRKVSEKTYEDYITQESGSVILPLRSTFF